MRPGPGVINFFLCSTQLSMKFIMLINFKMLIIVGILKCISFINTTSERLKARNFFCGYFMFFFCLVFAMSLCASFFLCALWSSAGKGLSSWLSFVVSNCEFVFFHWYPWSGVIILNCIDS